MECRPNTIPVELPVIWKKPDTQNYEELGIEGLENETLVDVMLVDLMCLVRANPANKPNETIIDVGSDTFALPVSYQDFKAFYKKHTGFEIPRLESEACLTK